MHELSLYGQVFHSRYDQVLKILAGVAAMQPSYIVERRIVYKPQREPEEPGSNLRRGGTQAIAVKQTKQTAAPALYYTNLVQSLSERDFGTGQGLPHDKGKSLSADVEDGEEPVWSMLFEDLPDTGDRGVSIRFTNSTDLLSGDPHALMLAAGPNQFVHEYYIEAQRFVYGNVIIYLRRVLFEPGLRSVQEAPKVELPSFASLQLLDSSGAYELVAKVRVQDFNNAAVLEAGVDELKKFQKEMKGCVELSLPDRLSFDTRVKYRPPPAPVANQNRPR